MSVPAARERDADVREKLGVLLAVLRRAARFWPFPLVAVVAGSIAAGVFSYLRPPTYRSEMVVLYSQGSGRGDAAASTELRSVTARLKELLVSRPTLERVVTEFGLYPEARRAHGISEGIDELARNVAFRAPGGDTFGIAFEGTSPIEAKLVTTRLAELVMADDSGLRRRQASLARDFLVTEKGKTEHRLRESERELAAFMAIHPRFALDAASFAAGAAIRASLAHSASDHAATGAQAPGSSPLADRAAAREGALPEPSRDARGDPNSEPARANAALSAARANLAERLDHYTAAHPDVRAATAAVERGERRLALASGDRTPNAPGASSSVPNGTPLPAPIRMASRAPGRLAPSTNGGNVAGPGERELVAIETQWSRLTRGATEARQRQDLVETRLFEADIAASSESGGHGLQMTVIDPAFLPLRPVPPGRTMVVAIFVGLSLVFGLFGAVLCAALDDHVYGARDLAAFGVVLVEVPKFSKGRGPHSHAR